MDKSNGFPFVTTTKNRMGLIAMDLSTVVNFDLQEGLSPKCSANPITVSPIWKWEFENKEHPIRGLYMTFFEKFLFKFPFSHKRFQMGQKMYFYQLYKL